MTDPNLRSTYSRNAASNSAGVRSNTASYVFSTRGTMSAFMIRWECEVHSSAGPVVRVLGASGDSLEFTCERRQVVDFEVLAIGSQPGLTGVR